MKGMRDGIPLVYRTFRNSWTVLHILLLITGVGLLTWWGISDGNAVRVLTVFGDGLLDLQRWVAGFVSWPWEAM